MTGSKGSKHNAERGFLDGTVQEFYRTPTAHDRGVPHLPDLKKLLEGGGGGLRATGSPIQIELSMQIMTEELKGCSPEDLDSAKIGTLNPEWVEWLMGFPIGWTDLDASGTPSSRRSGSTSGGSSSNTTKGTEGNYDAI